MKSGCLDSRASSPPVTNIDRYRDGEIPEYFRGDAAFTILELYRFLEGEGFEYTMCIPANDVLTASISHLLTPPVGRPSHSPKVFYESFSYQAQSWDCPRRVMAKMEWHWDELLPRVGFVVTNMTNRSRRVVHFYNQRGTAEQWIKEGKHAVKWTRLSCRSFKDNQARLHLFALAYNLGNFLRRLVLPSPVKHWSLTTLREKPIKIGAKVVRHAKYVTFQLAEVAVPRELFAAILDPIQRFAAPALLVQRVERLASRGGPAAGGTGRLSTSQTSQEKLPPRCRWTKRFDQTVKRRERPANTAAKRFGFEVGPSRMLA